MYYIGESSSAPCRDAFLCVSPIRDKHNRRILLLRSDKLPRADSRAAGGAGGGAGEADADAGDDKLRGVVCELLGTLSDDDVLVYLHAGLASTTGGATAWGARAFRRAVEFYYRQLHGVPLPAEVIAVHVSFGSRAHAAVAARFGGAATSQLYQRLRYCDVLDDIEEHLGVDATLLGLHAVDFEYDAVMRTWTGRDLDDPQRDRARMRRYNGYHGYHGASSSSADGSTSGSLSAFGIDDDDIQSCTTPSTSSASLHFPDPSKPLINVEDVSFHPDTAITPPTKDAAQGFDPHQARMLEEP